MKITLNTNFRLAIAGYMSSGSKLNSGYISPDKRDISGLKTLDKYISEDKEIKKTIKQYIALIEKDTTDIYKMIDYYIKTDENLSVQPSMCPATKPTSKKSKKSSGGGFSGGGGGHRFGDAGGGGSW